MKTLDRDPKAYYDFGLEICNLLAAMRGRRSKDYSKEMETLHAILCDYLDHDRFTVKQERTVERIRRKHKL